jgi:hypothetical protein
MQSGRKSIRTEQMITGETAAAAMRIATAYFSQPVYGITRKHMPTVLNIEEDCGVDAAAVIQLPIVERLRCALLQAFNAADVETVVRLGGAAWSYERAFREMEANAGKGRVRPVTEKDPFKTGDIIRLEQTFRDETDPFGYGTEWAGLWFCEVKAVRECDDGKIAELDVLETRFIDLEIVASVGRSIQFPVALLHDKPGEYRAYRPRRADDKRR